MESAGAGLGRKDGCDDRRGKNVGDVEVVSVRLTPLGHGELVLSGELLFGNRHYAALGPFVEKPMLKEEGVPASDAGDFLSLREMPKVVHLHVQMGGSALQIHQLITHGAYFTINAARAPPISG